jgi:hypothetical protein
MKGVYILLVKHMCLLHSGGGRRACKGRKRMRALLVACAFGLTLGLPAAAFEPTPEVVAMVKRSGGGLKEPSCVPGTLCYTALEKALYAKVANYQGSVPAYEEDPCIIDPDCELHAELQLEAYIAKRIEAGGIFSLSNLTIAMKATLPPLPYDTTAALARARVFSHEPL